jgi:hypothetical protein
MKDAAPQILLDEEWRLVPPWEAATLATVVFSAKESLFKCLYPLILVFFEFQDACVESIVPASDVDGVLSIRLRQILGPEIGPDRAFIGRYAFQDGHVHTGIELGAEGGRDHQKPRDGERPERGVPRGQPGGVLAPQCTAVVGARGAHHRGAARVE